MIGDMGGVTYLHGFGVPLSVIIGKNRNVERFWQWSIKNPIGESGVYLLMCGARFGFASVSGSCECMLAGLCWLIYFSWGER